jgi:fatty acid desaturase
MKAAANEARPSDILLSAEEDAQLRSRSNLMGAWLVFHAWALIAAAMALFVAFPNPLSFLIAVMVIGNRQLGLAILMHDASHQLLFANGAVNDKVGHWLCGAPVGASLALYRPYHLSHHRHTQQADDPLRNTRTTYAGPLMRLIVAPYWVNYHLEHHLFVFTPCWKLPRAHRLLIEHGLASRMEIGRHYVEVLRRATSRPTDDGPSGPRQAKPAHL